MNQIYFEAKGEALLERIGMTKSEFARQMGIRKQNVKALFKTKNLETIYKAANILGVPFEMHIFEQGDHGLALADQSTAHDVGQLNPDAARWAGLCQAWLEKRFALNLPQEAGW